MNHECDPIAVEPQPESSLLSLLFKPMDLHHPLLSEFPELKEAILNLRDRDGHFRAMFDEYHQIDDQVVQIEEERVHATDCELENLKMRRVLLKDALYHDIRAASTLQMAH